MENKVLDVKGVIDFKTLEQQMTPKPIEPTETEIANEIRVNKIHNENQKIALINNVDPISFDNAVCEMLEILEDWYSSGTWGALQSKEWGTTHKFEEIIDMNTDRTFLGMARKIVLKVWVKDIDNKVYMNEKAMCKAHGFSYRAYQNRSKLGWNLEEIWSGEGHKKMGGRNPMICEIRKNLVNESGLIEFRGKTYKTIKDLCWRYWQQDTTVYSGLRKGRTIEEALFDKGSSQYEKIIWDFLDNVLKETNFEFYRDRTIKCILKKTNKNPVLDGLLDDKYFKTTDRILAMRMDFLIVQGNNLVAFIEYDGVQHYNEQSYLSLRKKAKYRNDTYNNLSDKEFIERFRIADKNKDEFAKIMNVPILRITAKKEDVIRTLIDSFLKVNKII